jgi:colanic acid/amylovoran biosynthesis glycosyltransferase
MTMRVAHVVGTYLLVSENWIDPQIREVPETESAVVCNEVANESQFHPETLRIFLSQPERHEYLWRAIEGAARRLRLPPVKLARDLRRWKPSLLHGHFGWCGEVAAGLGARLGTPFVVSFYGADAWREPPGASTRDRYSRVMTNAAAVIVEGPAMRARVIACGCPPERAWIVRLGIPDCEIADPTALRSGGCRILLLGRFCEKKGLVDGLAACREAALAGIDLTVTVVGDSSGDTNGERIKAQLRELASDRPLAGRVHFTGFIPPAAATAQLRTHDVFVCASRFGSDGDAEGGSPVILTQAMAQGLACVGTRHCDIPELIQDNVTGWLAESGDVITLGKKIVAVQADPARALAIRAAGIAHVQRYFRRADQVQQLSRLYAQCAA